MWGEGEGEGEGGGGGGGGGFSQGKKKKKNLLVWLPCRPRKHIYKPDGHNVITFNSKTATIMS